MSDGPMFSGISIKGQWDDGRPLTIRDDGPVTLKIGDAEAETYWSKALKVSSDGTVTYKLLPMDRA